MNQEKPKSRKTLIFYVVAGILVIVALSIFISVRSAAGPKPKIKMLSLDGQTLTVEPEDENLRLVYCLMKTPSYSGCDWKNSRELELEAEDTYYVYIKNLDTGTVSDPETFEFKLIDFSKYRM